MSRKIVTTISIEIGSLILCVEAPYMEVVTKQSDDILQDQDKAAGKALWSEECHNNAA